ncbi:unnamed protein product, partial [Amoebophrya sp. A25]
FSAPFCAVVLGQSKDLVGAGLAGWAQSSLDENVLNNATASASDILAQLFGFRLDWSTFPVVRVREVIPKTPDGAG